MAQRQPRERQFENLELPAYPHGGSAGSSVNNSSEYLVHNKEEGPPLSPLSPLSPSPPPSADPFRNEATNNRSRPRWTTGFWTRFPYYGFAALLAYLAGVAGVIAILMSSDGRVAGTWGWGHSPNTYLSVMAIVMNLLLSYAFIEGYTLSYWRKVLKGSTVAGLHYHWNAGQSIFGAVEGVWRGAGLLNGLAFIVWILSSARSPVTQSAAGIQSNVAFPTNGTIDIAVAQKLPEGYTGHTAYSRAPMSQTSSLTSNFSSIMRDYNSRATLKLDHEYCGDSCEATIKGFGFCADCSTEVGEAFSGNNLKPGKEYDIFSTNVGIWAMDDWSTMVYVGGDGGLQVKSVFKNNKTGTPKQYTRICKLQPSTMAYPVRLSDENTLNLRGTWNQDQCLQSLNYTGPSSRVPKDTTIGGFQLAMSNLFHSSAKFSFGGAVSSLNFQGNVANSYVSADSKSPYDDPTEVNWEDPTDDILEAIREVALRTSLFAATDPSLNSTVTDRLGVKQNVHYTGTSLKTIYSTDIPRMAYGAILGIVGLLAALPLYYGWWELGREVTMSPIEIAKAFDARMLAQTDEHDVRGLCKAGKRLEIKYNLGMTGRSSVQMI